MQELSCWEWMGGFALHDIVYDTTNYNHYYSMIGFMTPQILLYFNGDIFISTIQVTVHMKFLCPNLKVYYIKTEFTL